MKKALLTLFAGAVAILAANTEAQASHCIAWGVINPPLLECVEYGPDAPAGWSYVANSYVPAYGEVKLCHKTSGNGVCIKRSFAFGNTLVSNLGEFEGPWQVRSYWFYTGGMSTLYQNENLSCPTCLSENGLNNNFSAFVIKAITVRH